MRQGGPTGRSTLGCGRNRSVSRLAGKPGRPSWRRGHCTLDLPHTTLPATCPALDYCRHTGVGRTPRSQPSPSARLVLLTSVSNTCGAFSGISCACRAGAASVKWSEKSWREQTRMSAAGEAERLQAASTRWPLPRWPHVCDRHVSVSNTWKLPSTRPVRNARQPA